MSQRSSSRLSGDDRQASSRSQRDSGLEEQDGGPMRAWTTRGNGALDQPNRSASQRTATRNSSASHHSATRTSASGSRPLSSSGSQAGGGGTRHRSALSRVALTRLDEEQEDVHGPKEISRAGAPGSIAEWNAQSATRASSATARPMAPMASSPDSRQRSASRHDSSSRSGQQRNSITELVTHDRSHRGNNDNNHTSRRPGSSSSAETIRPRRESSGDIPRSFDSRAEITGSRQNGGLQRTSGDTYEYTSAGGGARSTYLARNVLVVNVQNLYIGDTGSRSRNEDSNRPRFDLRCRRCDSFFCNGGCRGQ